MKHNEVKNIKISEHLHQNGRYARFSSAIIRFWHDIYANYVGFCSKILYLTISTSRSSDFDAEKWFFCANEAPEWILE